MISIGISFHALISACRVDPGKSGMTTIHYATSNGSGKSGDDYTAASGTLNSVEIKFRMRVIVVRFAPP